MRDADLFDGRGLDLFLQWPEREWPVGALIDGFRAVEVGMTFETAEGWPRGLDLIDAARRALGVELARRGSPEAAAGRRCPRRPASLNDVLFGERRIALGPERGGPLKATKPYVFLVDEEDAHRATVRLRLFGVAAMRAGEAADALLAGLRLGLLTGQNQRLPLAIDRCTLESVRPRTFWASGAVRLAFPTILRLRRNGRPVLDAAALGRSAVQRAALLARWHGAALEADWSALRETCGRLRLTADGASVSRLRQAAPRAAMMTEGFTGVLSLEGDLTDMLPFLALGETASLGESTPFGYGRCRFVTDSGEPELYARRTA